MTPSIPFDNSYATLPDRFYTRMSPTPVGDPGVLAINAPLADKLGIDADWLGSDAGLQVLAGNAVPDGAAPLAQVYAGHQFGGFSPQLGDGRAILLGEVMGRNGKRYDIQLKGSGPTPYSRMGDGRAWVGPVLREYIVSEAMAALGVPTTRALAAVTTGQPVLRETALPGAVLTRVASSHIRVGTFQYFAARGDKDAIAELAEHARQRHFPDADGPLGLLKAVIEAQASLVATWLGLGFIHGVMNTDNTTISGETIDYGPCAFMDTYKAMQVFSSIDAQGRYAYARQPQILMWNLAQLATSLLPVLAEDPEAARQAGQDAIDAYPNAFEAAWLNTFRAKIGLQTAEDGDAVLLQDLLQRMEAGQADFTNTFRALGTGTARDQFMDPTVYDTWDTAWRERLTREGASPEDRLAALHSVNPALIPRTHRIEEAIQAAVAEDLGPFQRLTQALSTPFADAGPFADLARPPMESEVVPQTFCGT